MAKLRDKIGRRLPNAAPQPVGKKIVLEDSDWLMFAASFRHGPLPMPYMHEFGRRGNENSTNRRLKKLYNGAEGSRPYLTRPKEKRNSFYVHDEHLVYDLTASALAILLERGMLERYTLKRTDHFLHRLFLACISASIELACLRAGYEYFSEHTIISNDRCPEGTRNSSAPATIIGAGVLVVPDDLFGIHFQDRYGFFVLEADRGTESLTRSDLKQTSLYQKLTAYLEILRRRTYQTRWGISNLRILIVTTSKHRALNMIELLRQMNDPLTAKFLVAVETSMGPEWRVPSKIWYHLFHGAWLTVNGDAYIDR
jgi:hypothetical protein